MGATDCKAHFTTADPSVIYTKVFYKCLLKEAIQLGFLTDDYTDLDSGFVFGIKDYHTTGVLEGRNVTENYQ
jgi:hypothetical protein